MSTRMKILVLSSLVLNILLIGFIAGSISHRLFREDSSHKKLPELALKLSPEKAALFLGTMEKVRAENRSIYRQIRDQRRKIFDLLIAPQFDEASYQKEVDKLYELRGLMMRRLSNATKGLAAQFNQEEREALAKQLRHPPGFHWGSGQFKNTAPPIHRELPPDDRVPDK